MQAVDVIKKEFSNLLCGKGVLEGDEMGKLAKFINNYQ